MTQRLYYTDSYQTEFDATLVAITTIADRPAVQLDRTCFYPTSGGQPFDRGGLDGHPVVDVVAGENNEIWHLLEAAPTGVVPGATLHGVIDWPRRYDHMQQHSGQHLLSQLFDRLFGFETVSVHFGATESTLDLEATELTPAQLDEAEGQANDLIYRALPIKAYFVDEAGLSRIPLRRPPKVSGEIRIVEIDGFDYSACGGTHVRTTAEIGPLKLTKQERRRGQTRVTFLCGKRAVRDYATKHRLLNEVAALFSTDAGETPKLVERNLAQLKALQRELDAANEQLLRYEAIELADAAGEPDQLRIVTHLFADREVSLVKGLAGQLQQQPNVVALLGVTTGDKLTLIFARSTEVDYHLGELLRDTLQLAGGKGGGRPDFAQGGVADPSVGQQLLDAAVAQVKATIGD
jgi:alanyl-tRNA synthetase